MDFTNEEKLFLLDLARSSINYYLKNNKFIGTDIETLPSEQVKKELACFVTLTIDNNLRGCIGHLEAIQPLYLDIIENAVSAALNDYRFPQVSLEELEKIKIEISILTKPEILEYSSEADLLNKLQSKPGVILSKNGYQSTFLPQVWEDLTDPKDFLEHLAIKAGLDRDEWKDAEYKIYNVIKFQED
jgi:uncharacterized protein